MEGIHPSSLPWIASGLALEDHVQTGPASRLREHKQALTTLAQQKPCWSGINLFAGTIQHHQSSWKHQGVQQEGKALLDRHEPLRPSSRDHSYVTQLHSTGCSFCKTPTVQTQGTDCPAHTESPSGSSNNSSAKTHSHLLDNPQHPPASRLHPDRPSCLLHILKQDLPLSFC